jgi:hypothetical protein
MGIPRARGIEVGGVRYHWRGGERGSWIEHAGPWEEALAARAVTVVVQLASGRGRKLVAHVPMYATAPRREDVTTPHPSGGVTGHTPSQDTSVTPKLVRRLIELALDAGWSPEDTGAELVLDASIVRRALG